MYHYFIQVHSKGLKLGIYAGVFVVYNNKTAGSGSGGGGGGGGGADPALLFLFHENLTSPLFFWLSQITFLVSKICIKLKDILLQKLINIRGWLKVEVQGCRAERHLKKKTGRQNLC